MPQDDEKTCCKKEDANEKKAVRSQAPAECVMYVYVYTRIYVYTHIIRKLMICSIYR